MSDTPRTDEAELDEADFTDWGTGPSGFVPVEFARELEREVNELKAAKGYVQDYRATGPNGEPG